MAERKRGATPRERADARAAAAAAAAADLPLLRVALRVVRAAALARLAGLALLERRGERGARQCDAPLRHRALALRVRVLPRARRRRRREALRRRLEQRVVVVHGGAQARERRRRRRDARVVIHHAAKQGSGERATLERAALAALAELAERRFAQTRARVVKRRAKRGGVAGHRARRRARQRLAQKLGGGARGALRLRGRRRLRGGLGEDSVHRGGCGRREARLQRPERALRGVVRGGVTRRRHQRAGESRHRCARERRRRHDASQHALVVGVRARAPRERLHQRHRERVRAVPAAEVREVPGQVWELDQVLEGAPRERLHGLRLAQRQRRLQRLRVQRRACALGDALQERLREWGRERRARGELRGHHQGARVLLGGRRRCEPGFEVGEQARHRRRRDARHRRQRLRQEHGVKRGSRAGRALCVRIAHDGRNASARARGGPRERARRKKKSRARRRAAREGGKNRMRESH